MNIPIFFCFICFIFLGFFLIFLLYGVFFFLFLDWFFVSLKLNFYLSSLLFSLVLFFVTFSVLIFCSYYMEEEMNLVYFLLMFMVFVLSMFFLNFSSGVFSMLGSWDILGISSFFLGLFYNNWDSCSGAMHPVLTNRLGDFFLFIFFCYFIFSNLIFFLLMFCFVSFWFFLILAGFTKSAQFPFSGWLPKAMSAPTPVSALVHSSTLVTAGLILIMGFDIVFLNNKFNVIILWVGLLTMFFSSFCALFENDMKKIVALSTLSQMGFSMLCFGLGLYFVSLIHLVSHALFKSCLFMQVGVFIHSFFGQQDGRGYNSLGSSLFFIQLQMVITLFCLCGLFFTSGAITKDLILEFFFFGYELIVMSGLFFFSVFLTFIYSVRLFFSLLYSFNVSCFNLHVSVLMGVFSFILVCFSVFGLWWLSNNVCLLPLVFLYVDFYVSLIFLGVFGFVIFFCFMFFLFELKYKFIVDFISEQFSFMVFNNKFFDVGMNVFVVFFLNFCSMMGYFFVFFFSSLNLSVVVIVIFILMFFF
uniref:NADH:ubiquinone reductase (H(+)-translocating) n=1 Tax=Wellcomia siamensis TaxID=435744 RepID=G4V261_WELSI|nr:NADH dehydrogenase subunit 5 [Wellcomia siamensis]ACV96778.1 NADH dehydrogenase subunit 5 [Wellcomia siamensis]